MRILLLAIAVLLLATGCGGDAGDSAAPATSGSGGSGSGGTLQAWQQEMLDSVNGHRTSGVTVGGTTHPAVVALVWDDRLAAAAQRYAQDMQDNDAWNHVGSDGSTVGVRVTDAGYAWTTCGENIAKGQTSVAQVMSAWMNSSGHRANIMNGAFREAGFARVGNNWVQVFAAPVGGVVGLEARGFRVAVLTVGPRRDG